MNIVEDQSVKILDFYVFAPYALAPGEIIALPKWMHLCIYLGAGSN
jgi:hypothetical protein